MLPEDVSRAVYGVEPEGVRAAMADEVAAYFGVPVEVAVAYLRDGGPMFIGAWLHANPLTDADIVRFYAQTPTNILCSLNYYETREGDFAHEIARRLRTGGDSPYRRILNYSDGSGELTIYLRSLGYAVAYADCGRTVDFMRWRLARRGIGDIPTFDVASEELPDERYDAVTCIQSMAHYPNVPAVIAFFAQHVRVGGMLVVDFESNCGDPSQPFHLVRNREHYERFTELLAQNGFRNNGQDGMIYHGV